MPAAPVRGTPSRAGFTLLEFLTALLVIGILTGMVIGVGGRATESAKSARARAELAALSGALEAYRRAFGDYPRTDDPTELLAALRGRRDPAGRPVEARAALAPGALQAAPPPANPGAPELLLDPWGQPYRYAYRVPAAGWTNSGFVLFSAGPDGAADSGLLAGGYPDLAAEPNADNLYATR